MTDRGPVSSEALTEYMYCASMAVGVRHGWTRDHGREDEP